MIIRTRSEPRSPDAEPPAPPGGRRARLVLLGALVLALPAGLVAGPSSAALLLGSCLATWVLAPAAAAAARRLGATVLPGGRSIHNGRVPLLGGLALFAPVAGYLVAMGGPAHTALAIGCGMMVLTGALDDILGLRPAAKIAAQAAGALVLVSGGYRIPALDFAPLGSLPTTGYELVLVAFWVVLATNAVNLIDGMDGLAVTITLVTALACAALGLSPGPALVLAGASLGFLRHNLPRARIFLGDTGSLLVGFLLAAFLMDGSAPLNVPLTLGLLAIPLGDVVLSTVRRWLRGKPVFSADRGHVHHLLLRVWGGSPYRVLAGLGALAAVHAAVVAFRPDLVGLLGVAALWALTVGYLLRRGRPAWTHMLLHRRSFRRIHLVRQYAQKALRLAENAGEVRRVLVRVAQDFRLRNLEVRGVRIELAGGNGGLLVTEHVDCGDSTAFWSAVFDGQDPVLAEEKRSILCDLLREASRRLGGLETIEEAARPTAPEPRRPAERPAGGRARVHYIADGRERLERLAPLVRETRRRGALDPVLVHTGRRDDLELTEGEFRELGLDPPAIDLDVPREGGVVFMARVMERYHALLEAERPAAVVVGDSSAGVACALVARERGIPVAHVGEPGLPDGWGRRPPRRPVTESIADLILAGDRPGPVRREPLSADLHAAHVVPALEALLARPGPGA